MSAEYVARFHPNELSVVKPDVFDDPSLKWLTYGETRRPKETENNLAGNVAEGRDILAYNFPHLVESIEPSLGEDTVENLSARLVLTKAIEAERKAGHQRIVHLMARLGLHEIARPKPVHETDFSNADNDFSRLSASLPRDERLPVDAVFSSIDSRGIMFSPADCPIIVIADTKEQSVTAIHAGYRGLGANIIGKTLDLLPVKPQNALVYITPHARNGFTLYGKPLFELEASPVTKDHLTGSGDKKDLDFAGAIQEQLGRWGVTAERISVSDDNSMTDPTLYSQRAHREKGYNGRNAVMVGKQKV